MKGTTYACIIYSLLPLWGVLRYTTFGMASTMALASCLGVILYDPKVRVAGLLHMRYPSSMSLDDGLMSSSRFRSGGSPEFIQARNSMQTIMGLVTTMERHGSDSRRREQVIAHLLDGAQGGDLPEIAKRALNDIGIIKIATDNRYFTNIFSERGEGVGIDAKNGDLLHISGLQSQYIPLDEQAHRYFDMFALASFSPAIPTPDQRSLR